MPRIHRMTHPVLGPVSWKEIQAAAGKIRKSGKRICSWCFKKIPLGFRTRCGNPKCIEMIWQVQSWGRCQKVTLRKQKLCPCGKRAAEVDHIIPVSLGGLGDASNRRGLCRGCHKLATAKLRKQKTKYKPWMYGEQSAI